MTDLFQWEKLKGEFSSRTNEVVYVYMATLLSNWAEDYVKPRGVLWQSLFDVIKLELQLSAASVY